MIRPFERRSLVVKRSAHADVQVELTLFTFNKVTSTIVLSSLGLIGLNWLLASRFGDRFLWNLTFAMILVCLLRLAIVLAFFRRAKPLTEISARQWERFYGYATVLSACMLAVSTLYNFQVHDEASWILCTLSTFMLCGSLGERLGTRPWIVVASSLVTVFALAISLLRARDPLVRPGVLLIFALAFAQSEAVRAKFEIFVEQLRSKRKLREYAEQDGLTGLANRRFFSEELARMCGQQEQFAVLFLDLDRFKAVNDTFGHATGDTLLQQVAGRLREAIRKEDILARLGGDEFAILQVPLTSDDAATALARRINLAIALPFFIEGQEISIGASVGIKLSSADEIDPQRLLNMADAALYLVKQAGRGSFTHA